ncbi:MULTISPECIES: MFS transporter [Micromonospora]|uniref:MFS transporter n=1 Tax=Micromonospora solifontis TaxID=2487138 RepID=A0ABX9WC97_9ACTN|nr:MULTISPECIES: MFS transporter [Micromonospora]NES13030.1 MFS transporter [Micromonospora sp. PPF5-17B]NES38320.1 MFS transporter [Micromonospora solifontis]NES54955.1 MFS transporter [Micromonospora sp. PPF5-6]RNL96331.1 MFS transporter [Micromonospora solifontis]
MAAGSFGGEDRDTVSSTIDTPAVDRPAVPRPVLTARNGVTAVFALNGLAVATWFSRVPAVREALGLSAGRLGLLLLAMSAGALVAMSTAGLVTLRLGPARTVAVSTVLVALGLTGAGLSAGLAGSLVGVAVGLFALGYGSGACDVAMNVEGAAVEKRLGRTIMPRFHAAWSLGSVAGAGLGAGAARLGVPVGWHLSTVAAVVLAGTLLGVRAFLPAPAEPAGPADPAAGRRALLATWREPRTLLIGLFVLVMAFTEGSANDWLAVAFVDGYGVSEAVGAAVFGVFVVGMTLGRTAGTVAIDRWGRVRVLFGTIGLAAVGATLAVLAGSGPVAVVGVALWGIGASLGFPVGMSAAADDEDRAPARVSVVAMIGYTAFLGGPPLLGFLGDRLGILSALGLVPLLLLPTLALVPVLRPPAR